MSIMPLLQVACIAIPSSIALYFLFIGALTIPYLQNHVVYLHATKLTWFKNVSVPEQWGFLHNQVTPFQLLTPDHETLHAWHILPLELYRRHESELIQEPSGLVRDITSRLGFQLLRDDPEALLVLYFHGAAGTLGSGWRPASYRALYSGAPDKIHTIAIDYRGFGTSSGTPSEEGLLMDAVTLTEWAMNVVGISSSRIVIFGQSLGTAVSLALTHRMSLNSPPTLFAGMVLIAPFADVETLTATYHVAGTIPLLSPVAYFPSLLSLFNKFIVSKWASKDKLADFIQRCEKMQGEQLKYHITILHAEDDIDIPWSHSEKMFWHAANAASGKNLTFEELENEKATTKKDLGAGGWLVEHRSRRGVIREQIIKHGYHDVIMSFPVVSLAVLRAFHSAQERAAPGSA